MTKYTGTLSSSNISGQAKLARSSFYAQMRRCYSAKSPKFKYYGGKGVKVEYSIREFIGWWIDRQKVLNLTKPSVGRIDHNSNYSFENIELVEISENSSEMLKRVGNPVPKKRLLMLFKDEPFISFGSIADASFFLKKTHQSIILYCRGQRKPRNGANFKFYGDIT